MKLKEVSAIFSQFPDKLLSQLVEETGVDHGVSR
jgi:hypothetical protein